MLNRFNSVLISSLGLLVSLPSLADNSLKEVDGIAIPFDFGGKPLPKWEYGNLLVRDSSSGSAVGLTVFDKAGTQILSHLFQIPGARYITVRDATRSADGTIGLCGSLVDADGSSSTYLAFLNPSSLAMSMVRTSPFQPTRMTSESNGTFWVAGYETTPRDPASPSKRTLSEAVNKDAHMFRQFDATGKLLRSAVPLSLIEDPVALLQPGTVFAEAGEEMVWYSGSSNHLISLSKDGSVREEKGLKLPEDQHQTGFGVTSRGEIVVSGMGKATWSVLKLLPSRREWQVLAHGEKADHVRTPPILVVGAEGTTIAALSTASNPGLRTFLLDED